MKKFQKKQRLKNNDTKIKGNIQQRNPASFKRQFGFKKHVKTTKEKKGGIFPKESFIHLSNLKLIDEKVAKKKEAKK